MPTSSPFSLRHRLGHALSVLFCTAAASLLPAADVPLTVTLVSEVTSIQPGVPFYVGLHLQHGPAFHSYWKYPGIVGVPTGIRWSLPSGFVAGEIEWPEPESVLMFKIKAQGFERDVLLPIPITPPADLKPGETIRLQGKSSWMSCAQSCHPGFTEVSLELPVKASAPQPDAKWQPVFEQERTRYPAITPAWKARAEEQGQTVTLTLTPAEPAARRIPSAEAAAKVRFFTEDGWIDSDRPQPATLNADGSLTLVLTRAEIFLGKETPKKLEGVMQNPEGWVTGSNLRSIQIAPEIKR